MKKLILLTCICAGMALTSCSGNQSESSATDSTMNANDTATADTNIMSTDTSSTGVDNSSSGGHDLIEQDTAKN